MRGGTARTHRRGDHRDTLSSRNNLAGAYQPAGDLGRAIPLYEQTLADRERALGGDHPDHEDRAVQSGCCATSLTIAAGVKVSVGVLPDNRPLSGSLIHHGDDDLGECVADRYVTRARYPVGRSGQGVRRWRRP